MILNFFGYLPFQNFTDFEQLGELAYTADPYQRYGSATTTLNTVFDYKVSMAGNYADYTYLYMFIFYIYQRGGANNRIFMFNYKGAAPADWLQGYPISVSTQGIPTVRNTPLILPLTYPDQGIYNIIYERSNGAGNNDIEIQYKVYGQR